MQAVYLDLAIGGITRPPPVPPRPQAGRSDDARSAMRLGGKRILVVEDEFLLADEIADWLRNAGADPVGPVARLTQAQKLFEQTPDIDCAVLDINLAGTMVFPLALDLQQHGVPVLFASAYSEDVTFPEELKASFRLKKPFSEAQLIRAVELTLDTAG